MTAPYRHVDAPVLMGSWPIVGSTGSYAPSILPRTVLGHARILGTARQPALGYDVGGKSFVLYVDSVQFIISFTSGNKTLAEVVSEINAITTFEVAFVDNGFLRLESPLVGQSSTLYLETSASQDVLFELGLLAGLESKGGDLVQAATTDFTRQIATHGQLSWAEGEEIESRVFNRSLFQVAFNTDLVEGVVGKKRISIPGELEVPSYTPPPSGPAGVTVPGFVYTGDNPTPSLEELEKWFVVLDDDGKELIKEKQVILNADIGANFTTDPDTGDCWVAAGSAVFEATDPQSDMYVVAHDLVPPADVLNDKPLKIIKFEDAQHVVIWPVDPDTGNLIVVGTQTGKSADRVRIDTLRCRVSGVYDGPGSGALPVMADARVKETADVTRIDLGNRVYCELADFATVLPGDLVVWSGHSVTNPYSNNGTYRVARKIDNQTLELVSEDWGSAVLNPDIFTASPGSITVSTDGAYWGDPFLRFDVNGALPTSGDPIKVLYYGMSTFRTATDDPAFFVGPGLRYGQEVDYITQKAILAIIGPSATTLEAYVRDDRRINLEDLDLRLDHEHYDYNGRHKDIRPDHIDMYPDVDGTTLTLRTSLSDIGGSTPVVKARLRKSDDTENWWLMMANGYQGFGLDDSGTPGISYPRAALELGQLERFVISGGSMSAPTATANYDPYGYPLLNGHYYYKVTAVDPNYGESLPNGYADAIVDGVTANFIVVTWSTVAGAAFYNIYRSVSAGGPYNLLTSTYGAYGYLWDDGYTYWDSSGGPPSTPSFYSGSFVSQDQTSFVSGAFAVGTVQQDATFNVGTQYADSLITNLECYRDYYGVPQKLFVHSRFGSAGLPLFETVVGSFQVDTGTPYENLAVGCAWTDSAFEIFNPSNGNRNFAVSTSGQMFLGYESSSVFSGTIFVRKPSGDQITFWNSSSSEYWKLGSRTSGNFYVDVGTTTGPVTQKWPMVFDTDTGFVGIGHYSRDSVPDGALHVMSMGDSAFNMVLEHRGISGNHAGGPKIQLEYDENFGATDDQDLMGALYFRASYAADTYAVNDGSAAIIAQQVGTASATNAGTKLSFWTTPQNTITRRESMSLSASGDLTLGYGALYITAGRFQNHAIQLDSLELNRYGSGDRYSYIDFWAYDAEDDYSARIIRNAGTSAQLIFENTGTNVGFQWVVNAQSLLNHTFSTASIWRPWTGGSFWGYSDAKWYEIWGQYIHGDLVYGRANQSYAGSQTALVARHAQNACVALVRVNSDGTYDSSNCWNIDSITNPSTGSYVITLTQQVAVSCAYTASCNIAPVSNYSYTAHPVFSYLTSPTYRVFYVYVRRQIDGGTVAANCAFSFVVMGRPYTMPS